MKLIEPTTEYLEQIRAYRQEFLDNGDSMDGCGPLRRFENVEEWFEQVERYKHKETIPPDLVTATQYIFVRETDNKVLGMIQVRHYLNDYLSRIGGHIGYSVRPSERRKGYATEMLACVLPECKKLGLDRVMVSCNQDNEGSRRTILNNGGVYDATVFDERDGRYVQRYWIDLKD